MYQRTNDIDRIRRAFVLPAMVLTGLLALAPAARAGDDEKEKPEYPPFEEVTKDFTQIDGFFPLYYEAKTDRLLAVIPQKLIGTDFLIARSFAAGGSFTGNQFGHSLVHWEEFNKKLLLVEPELRRIRDKKSTLEDVIDRTYTDTVVLTTPIVTKRGNDPVIDLDSIFKRDTDNIGQFIGGKVDPSISKWVKKKGFENNVELAVEAVFMSPDGGNKATIHYSLSRLPENDYQPREADDRIGYFLTARQDWNTDHDAHTTFKRYIHRWRLRKAEPDKAVSDVHPDDQIVFYIEKTVPVKFRRYIREGIEMWNTAFEKAGLRNAVVVRQQTDSNEFANIDPEDVNYNFFRWIVSGRAFARGPSRANPRTGQILDADIIMDDSIVRVWYDRYDRLMATGPATAADAQLSAFLDAHPEWRYQSAEERLMPGFEPVEHNTLEFEPIESHLFSHGEKYDTCSYANGVAHEMCLGMALLGAENTLGINRDEYVGQWIRLVACHEVGHTLGLRHNFKASSWLPLEAILAADNPEVPTTGSVMDYNPAVYNLDHTPRKAYLSQVVGPYDNIAIEYGYRIPTGDEKEGEMLAKIASGLPAAGLDFSTDENSSFLAPDPLVNAYDHSNDPVAWAAYRMDLVDGLRKDMASWAIKDGESFARLRSQFDMLLFEYSRTARFAARVIGGQYLHRAHRGDPEAPAPIEIIPAKLQRDALAFLNSRVLSASAMQFDPALLNQLAPGRWAHWGSDEYDSQEDYPVHERIAAMQYWVLFHLTNPVTVRRVYDAELKVPAGEDAMTVASLIEEVADTVWSELGTTPSGSYTPRNPLIPSIRRNLQREHLQMLTRLVMSRENGAYPPDAIAVARQTLGNLRERISKWASSAPVDTATRAHLVDSVARIDKALDASYEL
ncbi:MAG: zinc-dependent metalloprotease [Phycisphaerales bacterium]|nr:zinc-dependent metalloprotease [Phycisphaerales bacterium]